MSCSLSLIHITFILTLVFTSSTASAVSLYLSYDKHVQDVPLYQQGASIQRDTSVTMHGYGIDLVHTINELWFISLYGQQSEAEEFQTDPSLQVRAEQQAYSASVNYMLDNYTITMSYHQLNFDLFSSEAVDYTKVIRSEKYISYEDIKSESIELNISRDIDFDSYWLTLDVSLSSVEQQALFDNYKSLSRGENERLLAQTLTEQNSDSWLVATTLSWATLWSWRAIDFVPSARLSFTTVIAGDDVYLFNSVTVSARTGDISRLKTEQQEPLTGDSAVIAGGSLTVLISESLYVDLNFNRFYADSSTANYLSLGIGWDF